MKSEARFPDHDEQTKEDRLRVLFACNSLAYFCAHRTNLVESLVKDGHEIWVCAAAEPGYLAEMPDGVRVVPVDLNQHRFSLFSDMKLVKAYLSLTRAVRPDIVHAITMKPNLYFATALALSSYRDRKQPRLIMTFPGLGKIFEPGAEVLNAARRWIVCTALSWAGRRLDHFATFENPHDQETLVTLGLFERENTQALMGAGIDFKQFHLGGPKSANGPLRFLFASRMLKAKGVETYIQAAKSLAESGSYSSFAIAGAMDNSNPDAFDIAEFAAAGKLHPVVYLGAVDAGDMPKILGASDIVCLPTQLSEGFPRILLEAAACGCAMIASDQPAIRQIVIPGRTGWLIDPNSQKSLSNAMRLAEQGRENTRAVGEEAARFVQSIKADNESISAGFTQIYEAPSRRGPL